MLRYDQRINGLNVLLELLHVALEFGPTVLEPRYHLGVAQAQLGCDLVPVGGRQILLVQKTLLELEYLLVREGRATLSLLLGLLTIVE